MIERQTGKLILLWATLAVLCSAGPSGAAQLWLKDGRVLEGRLGLVSGLADLPKLSDPNRSSSLQLIAFVDDGLRRTFISKRQIREFRQEDSSEIFQKYRIRQQVMHTGPTVAAVGPILAVEPFDRYGRRILTMNTARGPVSVIQCITEITPVWTKVEGHTHVWDMRIATSSIPPDTLAKILAWQTDRKNLEDRKSIVRFYLQAERYEQALAEVESILKDFPDEPDLAEQLEATARRIRQLSAQRLLDELKLRRSAGQHRLVVEKLRSFPSEGVASRILEEVRQMLDQYAQWESQRKEVVAQLEALLPKVADSKLRLKAAEVCKEIGAKLSYNTLDRMAPFHQLLSDQTMPAEEKLALAISGWLRGGKATTTKLPLAVSMFQVRKLIVEYMRAEDRLTQRELFERIRSLEAGTPQIVASLVAHMEPPLPVPAEAAVDSADQQAAPALQAGANGAEAPGRTEQRPATAAAVEAGSGKREGFFRLEVVPVPNSPPVEYLVQLPPEYDPLRRYPAIVTLHGAGSTPETQTDFWAGPWTEGGWRFGQATRHGYIVIAPAWAAPYQKHYQYTMREHAAVLRSLRDACRRFAIDTDRVFLTGHSMGGDAAWDIGLAHPDLWAGVIPIAAQSDRYCPLYWQNAQFVPFYFVCGELDGDRMTINARDFDRYLRRGFKTTVVEFLGRGHEFFSDEIHRMFDWMGRYRRNFFPREFTVRSMRPWDSFFWWLELEGLPAGAMVDPANWPPPRGTQPMEIRCKLTPTNTIYVTTGAGLVRIFASPEMFQFGQRISVILNGRRIDPRDASRAIFSASTDTPAGQLPDPFSNLDLQLETILEDVRTRSDRIHPFWVRLEVGSRRR